MSFGGTRADVGKVESILVCRRRADHRSRHQCVAEQPSCAPTFTTMYHCSSLLFGGTRADVGQCRSVLARGTVSTIDHRPRHPCTVAPPSCATRLSTMYQYSLSAFGETSADVGQCRLVEARGAVSTIDVAARARWHRLRVRQGCLRCTSTRCGGMAGPRADVGQCRLVEARGAVSTVDLAARARWRRRRVRQGCLRCTSTCSLRADVGQCRLVEARGAVSTIDVAARAQWCRRRVRQGCL
jgi:hypothetical protein